MLRHTHIPVPSDDTRRLDLVVPCLNVARGLPLFCDVTVVTPLTGTGQPRAGTSNVGGRLLQAATLDVTYHEVVDSGHGVFLSLGAEVFVRMSEQAVTLLPAYIPGSGAALHSGSSTDGRDSQQLRCREVCRI